MSLEFDMRDLTKKLGDLEKKLQKTVAKNALTEGAKPMVKSLKKSSPVDTGELRDSIKTANKIKTKKGRYSIDMGVTGEDRDIVARGYYQHYGSRSRAGTYWMSEGFNNSIDDARKEMIKILREELK